MDLQDLKAALGQLTVAERAEIEGHLRILRWKDTPALAEQLSCAHARMDAGGKISQEEVARHMVRRHT